MPTLLILNDTLLMPRVLSIDHCAYHMRGIVYWLPLVLQYDTYSSQSTSHRKVHHEAVIQKLTQFEI